MKSSTSLIAVSILALSLTNCSKDTSTVIIAHRGGMVSYPENSLIAFEKATKYTKYIEMDIRFSKDNVPVIIHDENLSRTTNCNGLISNRLWSYLSKCSLKERFGKNPSGHFLSTFQDALKSSSLQSSILIVEIKDENYKAINLLLHSIKSKNNIYLQSFHINILQHIHNNYKFSNLYLISKKMPDSIPDYIKGLILKKGSILTRSKAINKKIFIYTVDTTDDFSKYSRSGIDGIITNDVRYFASKRNSSLK